MSSKKKKFDAIIVSKQIIEERANSIKVGHIIRKMEYLKSLEKKIETLKEKINETNKEIKELNEKDFSEFISFDEGASINVHNTGANGAWFSSGTC